MAKLLKKVDCTWSSDFAYAIGLIAADGNLSPSGRHINLTTKDKEMAINFKVALKLDNKVGRKARGGESEKKYYVVQFGDKNFYEFLLRIGMMPNKSKILGSLDIPDDYFPDFLRGVIDGDGSISTHSHPESKYLQLRLRITSASEDFLIWLSNTTENLLDTSGGWITGNPERSVLQLCYGKEDSKCIIREIYTDKDALKLTRKFDVAKAYRASGGIGKTRRP